MSLLKSILVFCAVSFTVSSSMAQSSCFDIFQKNQILLDFEAKAQAANTENPFWVSRAHSRSYSEVTSLFTSTGPKSSGGIVEQIGYAISKDSSVHRGQRIRFTFIVPEGGRSRDRLNIETSDAILVLPGRGVRSAEVKVTRGELGVWTTTYRYRVESIDGKFIRHLEELVFKNSVAEFHFNGTMLPFLHNTGHVMVDARLNWQAKTLTVITSNGYEVTHRIRVNTEGNLYSIERLGEIKEASLADIINSLAFMEILN